MTTKRAALFLDRDGTLIRHVPYLHDPAGVELIPGTREALERAQELGYLIFMHTNQSGVGRGMFTLEDVEACNRRVVELLGLGEDVFTDVCVAPEGPGQTVVYRKPAPRFALEMAARHQLDLARSWMVGDHANDVATAFATGMGAIALAGDYLTQAEADAWKAAGHTVGFFPSLAAFVETLKPA
jgi:D-glycero-D-manno-heptose 1,7-bisphosphate phosphatase